MTFQYPILLWSLLLLPLALLAYLFAQRRRAQYAVRFTNLDLLANVVQRSPGWRRHLPPALYLLSLGVLLAALARPQAVVPVPRNEATVMLVMDVSGSMEATDVQPSRLSAARSAAHTFLDQLPDGFQVGLVSFASSAQMLAAPTTDRVQVRQSIDGLRSGGGTAMGDGLALALEPKRLVEANATPTATVPARQPSPAPAGQAPAGQAPAGQAAPAGEEQAPMAIVLLSDGASSVGRVAPRQAADEAARLGVPVYTIALGTPNGVVTVPGSRLPIRVPPDERTLQQIAETTGGRFFSAPSGEELRSVYEDLGTQIGFVEEHQEVTALFAAAAIVLMLSGATTALLWFNRFP